MADGETKYYEGYCSIEGHMQDCMDFFLWLQQCGEKQEPRKGREPERSLEPEERQEPGEERGPKEGQEPGENWVPDEGLGERIILRKSAADILAKERNAQVFLPAPYLRERCGLTETEYWLVLFAFCCELESGLCLQFWKQNNKEWPTIQYALHLLSGVFQVDFTLLARLCAQEKPIGDILELPPESERNQGILQQPLLLSRTAFYFLLTGSFRQEQWCEFYLQDADGFREGTEDSSPNRYLDIHKEEYAVLTRYLCQNSSLGILVYGRQGSGKHTLFKKLISHGSRNGILVKMTYFCQAKASEWEKMEKSLHLADMLTESVIILDFQGMPRGGSWNVGGQESRLDNFLEERWDAGPVFYLADRIESAETVKAFTDIRVDLKEFLSRDEKRMVLDNFVRPAERRQWQDDLLGRYRMNIGELHKRLKTISLLAEGYGFSMGEELPWAEGIRETTVQNGLGRIIESNYSLEDLIIPRDCRRQLETVIKLSEIWFGGFMGWQAKREGLQLLFHGASGTGKTMAASVLAAHLHLPLFKVDLSRIFDKYIGETEKHLDEIFRMAQKGSHILFFDEADALFSKRMGLHDSHDKYANVATSYLLQRMEVFDGILILATNLMDHFDDAFVRRIRFVIKFRNLEKEDRALLWERLLSGEALSEDVSPKALAQAAELGPARIRVAAQTAKMLAASENNGLLTNEHLRIALELETGKDETVLNY